MKRNTFLIVCFLLLSSMQLWSAASIKLKANPKEVAPGGKTTISWTTSGATKVYFNGVGYVSSSGSRSFYLTKTTTYTIQAYSRRGWISKSVKVTVKTQPPPSISTRISPDPFQIGHPVTLSWSTTKATSVIIDQGVGSVALSGSITITPQKTTTYTLTAYGPGGTAVKKVTFTIPEKPSASLTVTPQVIAPGEGVILSWATTNATTITIDPGIGSVAQSGSLTLHPLQSTTYTLKAQNTIGQTEVTASVSIISGKNLYTFISHSQEKSVSVINLETLKVVRSVPFDFSPAGLALSQDGMWLYIGDPTNGKIHQINTQDYTITRSYSIDGEADELILSPEERHCMVTIRHNDSASLLLLNLGSGEVENRYEFTSPIAWLCINKELRHLYFIENTYNLIQRFDVSLLLEGVDQAGADLGSLDLPGTANSLTISADQSVLCAATDEKICFLNMEQFYINYWYTIHDHLGNVLPIKQTLPSGDGNKFFIITKQNSSKLFVLNRNDNSLKSIPFNVTGSSLGRLIPESNRVVIATVSKNALGVADIDNEVMAGSVDMGKPAYEKGLTVGVIQNPVSGRVLYQGQGLADVELLFTSGNIVRKTRTDIQGRFLIGLEVGSYDLSALKTGYRFEPVSVAVTVNGPVSVADQIAYLVPPSVSVTVSPQEIKFGAQAVLSWQSINAETLKLMPDGTILEASGTLDIHPGQTTIYTVVAQGPGGSASADVTVTVLPLPVIAFSADPLHLPPTTSSTLTWNVQHADSVEISPTIGVVAATGQYVVKPSETTKYTLKASGPGGSASADVTVDVCHYPLASLSLVPSVIIPGESANLSWSSSYCDRAELSGVGPVALSGNMTISPDVTTVYTFTAISDCSGSASKTVTLEVRGPPHISFSADPDMISPGEKAKLTWLVANATTVSIDQEIGTVPASGSREVEPLDATTYTLTATGSGGTSSASVTVKTLKNYLQQQWTQMKLAMQNGNVEAAVAFFDGHYQDSYRQLFNSLGGQLPQVASEMGDVLGGEFTQVDAKFIITRKEMYEGVLTDFAYDVIFVRDENGVWKILRF